jgi:hypothetical protein
VNVGESYEPLPEETVVTSVEGWAFSGVAQVASVPANTFHVIFPVGLIPVNVAVSEIGDPSATAECAWVVNSGVAGPTVETSLGSEHEVAGGAVFALSPE